MTPDSFFQNLQKLIYSFPKMPVVAINCDNCHYSNEVYNCKNLICCFDSYSSTDSVYIFDSFRCAHCSDCDYAVESELCYESVDTLKCYNSNYLEYCANVRDSWYSYDCTNCSEVFGCVKLKNKSFCIFNRQLSEQEYRAQVENYKKLSPEKILLMVEQLKKKYPLTQTISFQNVNTSYGNYIHYNKNCYLCFDAAHDEDCAYLYDSFYDKDSMDLTYTAPETELTYEAVDSARLFNCSFIVHSGDCVESSYLFDCTNVKNSIGCVGLKNKQYCILNKQYTQEEYEKISSGLLAQLKELSPGWANISY